MISGKKINEDLTVRYGMVRYGKFGVVPIQNDPLFYLSFYIFIQMRIIGIHLLFCIYYYNYTAVQYGWCICVYLLLYRICMFASTPPVSVNTPSSSLEFCSIFFFYLHVACNLAISQFYPVATVLSIPYCHHHPSIHICMCMGVIPLKCGQS